MAAMARPLRIERPGGRYHVTARGNERKAIYRAEADRAHFLRLLGQLAERFGLRVHAYVLMDNHFHLLVETPEANLSRAMQWLNVSYSLWFNRRHDRAGHLFQGRFKAVVVEDDAGWQEVARYAHLNPVRIAGLALDKRRRRAASRLGLAQGPSIEEVAERLRRLREYPWSSYRAYAGYAAGVGWLWREPLDRLCGGRTEAERRAALREYTEQAVRQGGIERPWDRLVAGLVLGTEAFAARLRRQARGNPREQSSLRKLVRGVSWPRIVAALEGAKGEKWGQFSQRHGDWGRDGGAVAGAEVGAVRPEGTGRTGGGNGLRSGGTGGEPFRQAPGAATPCAAEPGGDRKRVVKC